MPGSPPVSADLAVLSGQFLFIRVTKYIPHSGVAVQIPNDEIIRVKRLLSAAPGMCKHYQQQGAGSSTASAVLINASQQALLDKKPRAQCAWGPP